jgi:curved DNA-binding protein CbpA
MPVKDYYKLLKIEHSADLKAIKKAYRNLAMQYHPDKHGDNHSTQFYFREIQEAYETLSNPKKREEYHYQIWLEKAQGHALDSALTADQIIQLFIQTERAIHQTDSFRRNNEQLTEILINLYSNTRLDLIIESNDSSLEMTTIKLAMQSASSLPSYAQFKLIDQLHPILKKHLKMHEIWLQQVKARVKEEKFETYKIPVIIIITILLCLAILLLSK